MKPRLNSIDSLRTISILAVIAIHTTTKTLEAAAYNLSLFPFSIFLNQITRFAVPLFFVISGFVLEFNHMEKINTFEYFKKRFGRIAVPYVFWSLIYYFFVYSKNSNNLLQVLLKGNASYQLYFIPALCVFYLRIESVGNGSAAAVDQSKHRRHSAGHGGGDARYALLDFGG